MGAAADDGGRRRHAGRFHRRIIPERELARGGEAVGDLIVRAFDLLVDAREEEGYRRFPGSGPLGAVDVIRCRPPAALVTVCTGPTFVQTLAVWSKTAHR